MKGKKSSLVKGKSNKEEGPRRNIEPHQVMMKRISSFLSTFCLIDKIRIGHCFSIHNDSLVTESCSQISVFSVLHDMPIVLFGCNKDRVSHLIIILVRLYIFLYDYKKLRGIHPFNGLL